MIILHVMTLLRCLSAARAGQRHPVAIAAGAAQQFVGGQVFMGRLNIAEGLVGQLDAVLTVNHCHIHGAFAAVRVPCFAAFPCLLQAAGIADKVVALAIPEGIFPIAFIIANRHLMIPAAGTAVCFLRDRAAARITTDKLLISGFPVAFVAVNTRDALNRFLAAPDAGTDRPVSVLTGFPIQLEGVNKVVLPMATRALIAAHGFAVLGDGYLINVLHAAGALLREGLLVRGAYRTADGAGFLICVFADIRPVFKPAGPIGPIYPRIGLFSAGTAAGNQLHIPAKRARGEHFPLGRPQAVTIAAVVPITGFSALQTGFMNRVAILAAFTVQGKAEDAAMVRCPGFAGNLQKLLAVLGIGECDCRVIRAAVNGFMLREGDCAHDPAGFADFAVPILHVTGDAHPHAGGGFLIDTGFLAAGAAEGNQLAAAQAILRQIVFCVL